MVQSNISENKLEEKSYSHVWELLIWQADPSDISDALSTAPWFSRSVSNKKFSLQTWIKDGVTFKQIC